MVRIAPKGHAFAVEVLVHVRDQVHQSASLLHDGGGHVHVGDSAERIDKSVGGPQADGQVQDLGTDLAFGVQFVAAASNVVGPNATVT